jgi:hypothetical protein
VALFSEASTTRAVSLHKTVHRIGGQNLVDAAIAARAQRRWNSRHGRLETSLNDPRWSMARGRMPSGGAWLHEYLILLSISKTCKNRGVRFLDSLLPRESDMENRVLRLRGSMLSDAVAFSEGRVRGFIHHAFGDGRDGLVLTHGAGGNARMALLEAVARAFAEAGICVLRCDLSFRLRRPHGPPSPANAAADRTGLKEAAAVMRGLVPGRVFLGGQSYQPVAKVAVFRRGQAAQRKHRKLEK